MADQPVPVRLLRIAACVVDALVLAVALIVPATIVSYSAAWFGEGSTKVVSNVWWGAAAILCLGVLLRDGYGGRSPGKRLFGLKLTVAGGSRCGYLRSAARNLPLVVPGWNLLELAMILILRPPRRTGDLLARTSVSEE